MSAYTRFCLLIGFYFLIPSDANCGNTFSGNKPSNWSNPESSSIYDCAEAIDSLNHDHHVTCKHERRQNAHKYVNDLNESEELTFFQAQLPEDAINTDDAPAQNNLTQEEFDEIKMNNTLNFTIKYEEMMVHWEKLFYTIDYRNFLQAIVNQNPSFGNYSNVSSTYHSEFGNILNSYFASIGGFLARKIPRNLSYVPPLKSLSNNVLFHMKPFTLNEVKSLLLKIQNFTMRPDGKKPEVWKKVHHDVAKPITKLFNRMLKEQEIPPTFKVALIKPIYKKDGSRRDPCNYRPTSMFTNYVKLFEKLIYNRLRDYLEENSLFNDNIYGCRKKRGISDVLEKLTNYVVNADKRGNVSMVVFIDIVKAFDCVNHTLLIKDLWNLGIRDKIFENYFKGRKQIVQIGKALSDTAIVKTGLSQGSTLSPVLFTVYMNELLNLDIRGKMQVYFDDIMVFYKGETWQEVKNIAENDLPHIFDWLAYKALTPNLPKCFFMPLYFKRDFNNTHAYNKLLVRNGNKYIDLNVKFNTTYLGYNIEPSCKFVKEYFTSPKEMKRKAILKRRRDAKEPFFDDDYE